MFSDLYMCVCGMQESQEWQAAESQKLEAECSALKVRQTEQEEKLCQPRQFGQTWLQMKRDLREVAEVKQCAQSVILYVYSRKTKG